MSLINIINESFDKRNKSILIESKDKKLSKQLHESLTDQDKGHIVTEIARLMDKSDADLEDVLYDLGWNYNDDDWVPVIGRFIDDDSPDLDAVDDFLNDELWDDSLDIYDHVKRYKKYITDPEILKKYGKKPSYVTQLKTAFKRVDTTEDLADLVDDLMYGFYEKTRKILASKGFTNFSSEPSTQNMMGKDFFWAEKDGVKYEGSYDFETELEDISDFVINSNATTRKDLFNELAEWYADFVLSTLEPMEDDEDDEDDDLDENIFIKKQKRKTQKLKETTNKSLHEYFDYREAEDFDELGDMLDQSGDLIREAAEKLGFKDFEWEDSVQGPYGRSDFWITGDDGTRLHAMVDFSETWVTDLDEAIMLLDNLEWEDTSADGDNDEVNDDLNKLKSLSYIPESFFSNSKIKSIDIPGNIKSIEREAFSNCKKLEDITFSVGLKDIGEQAFYGCTRVEFIDFPEGLTTISDGAFMDCKSLISITIPTSVKSIGDDAFSFCPRLYEIRYNGTHQDWQQIKLGKRWAFHSLINIIECTDGTLRRSGPDPTICDWVFKKKTRS